MSDIRVCFDCGVPLFFYLDRGKTSVPDPRAAALGVSNGALHIGPRSWHLECARVRKPERRGPTRELLFTMRMSREEKAMFSEMAHQLDFADIAEFLRWSVRAEKLRRARIAEIKRRDVVSRPRVPAPAKAAKGGRSARPRGTAKK